MAFQYELLGNNPFQIRLLKILPAKAWDDPICLALEHSTLVSQPEYHALSYTWNRPSSDFPAEWDDPTFLVPVSVNGKAFGVRPNLHSALQAFRQTWPADLSWWVDTICINQSNIPERNEQVSRMKDIYEKAAITVAWLGPPDITTQKAFSKITELGQSWYQRKVSIRVTYIADDDIKECIEILHRELPDDDVVQCHDALRRLVLRSWWERAWVIQEACTASSMFVQSGIWTASWGAMISMAKVFLQYNFLTSKVNKFGETLGKTLINSLLEIANVVSNLERSIAQYYDTNETKTRLDLLSLLSQFRRTSVTDPRDKVYSAVGISDSSETMRIDYSLPVEDVYVQVAKQSLTKGFRVLGHCKFPPLLGSLPSWTPDWTDRNASRIGLPQKGFNHWVARNEAKVYSAAGDSLPDARFEDNDRILVVKGVFLEGIAFVSSLSSASSGEDDTFMPAEGRSDDRMSSEVSKTLQVIDVSAETAVAIFMQTKWLREWAASRTHARSDLQCIRCEPGWVYLPDAGNDQFECLTYLPSNYSLWEAYVHTVSADLFLSWESGHEARICTYEGELPEISVADMSMRLAGRRFAVSQGGLLALVPAETQVGDMIALIQGSEIPFILRASEKGHLLIGECYVHGVMDGEFWNAMVQTEDIFDIRIM